MEISVIIPTFNRQNTLKRAIDSVLAQSFCAKEIIVIDDGSTDSTKELLKNYPQIKYVFQENQGVSSARNLGIKISTCSFVAFLDSDDKWHKDKLQIQTNFHKNSSTCRISYTDELWIRDNKEIKINKKHKKQLNPSFESSLEHCQIGPSTVLADKKIFEEVGYFNEDMEVCEDYDLWLRVLKKYKIPLIQEKLTIKYADEKNQLSKKYWALDRWHIKSLFLHVENKIVQNMIEKKLKGLKIAALKYEDKNLLDECEKFLKMLKEY